MASKGIRKSASVSRRRMTKEDRKYIRIAIKSGQKLTEIAEKLDFSYQTVYAYASGKHGKFGRLLPKKSTILTDDHMKWAEKAKLKGLSSGEIANKLGVSEATFWRTRKDYRELLAEKVKRAMLVSSAKRVSETLGVRIEDIPALVERASENNLSKRLEKRLEGWEL
jgi:DNA-binding CsgD family transcriptional regulator